MAKNRLNEQKNFKRHKGLAKQSFKFGELMGLFLNNLLGIPVYRFGNQIMFKPIFWGGY
ncbi:hypothetical protein [Flagellimonas halotolerans]|uniref:Uncharacterized protein n=1 Tax=Flagellimonas halotolerans TaxID=3112164 RepID=A0ABU6ISC3_9FLAO|nr:MULTISPECIES: hypothetical protein [unclassified Allomuricauda]MEC3966162.1 hypothetical protein [Muricauda sp. SYSU M86414]MEC4266027.1 hypothetical protein [Muricauda sp. SYSU M84420]